MIDKFFLLFIIPICFSSCTENNTEEQASNEVTAIDEYQLIPISYDFENLNLYLNSRITDTTSTVHWDWNYMFSDNNVPDTTGIEYYMNREQPLFSFYGEKTLPTFFITTNKNRLIEFSASILFTLPDRRKESLNNLLDSVPTFDLLQDDIIRQEVLDNHSYVDSNESTIESIEITWSRSQSGLNEISYDIKNNMYRSYQDE